MANGSFPADEASEQLMKQEESRREGHKEILTDITVVRGNIQEVWERLGEGTIPYMVVCNYHPGMCPE